MDFLRKNALKSDVKSENASAVQKAETGWMDAKKKVEESIYELGKAYFEANKDNASSEFAEQIAKINNNSKEEYLWHQYRLSLDGQRMCDSCHSFITADSAFCNRCGAPVQPIDFSSVSGISSAVNPDGNAADEPKCPKCGKKLVEGAMFCEGCGTKIS